MKKIFKYIRNIFISVFSLIIIIAAFTQTGIFKDMLRDLITNKINESIKGKITVGRIGGTIFSDIEIHDVRISESNESVISAYKLEVNYNLFSLFNKKINIRSLTIDSIYFNALQRRDSSWNFLSLIESSEDTSSGSFDWGILLNKMIIKNSRFSFNPLDSTVVMPKTIKNFNSEVEGFYTKERLGLKINRLSFNGSDPKVIVKDFRLTAEGSEELLQLSDIYLETELNKLHAAADITINPFDVSRIKLQAEPVNLSEFSGFTTFRLNGASPAVQLDIKKENKNIRLESFIRDEEQLVEIKANLNTNSSVQGTVKLNIKNLQPGEFYKNDFLNGLINGDFTLKGRWENINESQLQLTGNMYNSVYFDKKITESKISAKLNSENLKSDISLSSDPGSANLSLIISNLHNTPAYSFNSNLKSIDLSKILDADTLDSNLNLMISGNGKGFSPDQISGDLKIVSSGNSRIGKIGLDSLVIALDKKKNYYRLDSLFLLNNENSITVKGEYEGVHNFNARVKIELNNPDNFKTYIKADSISGKVTIDGDISGISDSILITTDIVLDTFQLNKLSINSLKGIAGGIIQNSELENNFDFQLDGIVYDSMYLSKLDLTGEYNQNKINADCEMVFPDSLDINTSFSMNSDSTINIYMPDLNVKNRNKIWRNQKGPISFSMDKGNYSLKNFNLQYDSGYISLNGDLTYDDRLSAGIGFHSVELGSILNKLPVSLKFSGLTDLNIKAEGNIKNPDVTGELTIKNLKYDEYNIGNLAAFINLKNGKVDWDLTSVQKTGNEFRSSGYFSTNFFQDHSAGFWDENKEFEAKLDATNFDLTKAELLTGYFDAIEGNADCNITLSGSPKNPRFKGVLNLNAAHIQNDNLGINYRDIILTLHSDSNKIKIDTASFISNKGMVTISGYIGSRSDVFNGNMNDINLLLRSSEFELISAKKASLILDGQLHLYSEDDQIRFNGEFTIPKSSIYLSSILQSGLQRKDSDAPLLLSSIEKNEQVINDENDSLQIPAVPGIFGKEISGQIKINIPDNTWIKSPNMNIEIRGDAVLQAKNDELTINGRIETRMGYFYFYGKKFTVIKGEILFKGEKPINPYLNLTIEHTFRSSAREKEKISIIITNTVNDPKITYTHNDAVISEGDAVSYIIFGTKMDYLSQSQQSELVGNKNILSNALAGMLASQLSSQIGNKIGLDVFEIAGDEDWRKASLTAGKYLTGDLFVSYEHDIPLDNSSQTETDKINLEYELTRFLFLQLIGGNSKENGFNLILKFH